MLYTFVLNVIYFPGCIRRIDNAATVDCGLHRGGQTIRRSRKVLYVKNNRRIKAATAKYTNGEYTKEQFLRCILHSCPNFGRDGNDGPDDVVENDGPDNDAVENDGAEENGPRNDGPEDQEVEQEEEEGTEPASIEEVFIIPSVSTERETLHTCIICTDRARSVMFAPCLHIIACEECASRLMRGEHIDPFDRFVEGGQPRCPTCRREIDGYQRVYF